MSPPVNPLLPFPIFSTYVVFIFTYPSCLPNMITYISFSPHWIHGFKRTFITIVLNSCILLFSIIPSCVNSVSCVPDIILFLFTSKLYFHIKRRLPTYPFNHSTGAATSIDVRRYSSTFYNKCSCTSLLSQKSLNITRIPVRFVYWSLDTQQNCVIFNLMNQFPQKPKALIFIRY